MADKKNHDERLERLMNQLAESVLGLSDEDIAETSEVGADPEQEAEYTRSVLRKALGDFDNLSKRLSNLGHTINSNDWWCVEGIYHNCCLSCNSLVNFTTATGEMKGEALNGPCLESDQHTIRRQKAACK